MPGEIHLDHDDDHHHGDDDDGDHEDQVTRRIELMLLVTGVEGHSAIWLDVKSNKNSILLKYRIDFMVGDAPTFYQCSHF